MTSAGVPVEFFETVDMRDMGMIERGEDLGFALKPREAFAVSR